MFLQYCDTFAHYGAVGENELEFNFRNNIDSYVCLLLSSCLWGNILKESDSGLLNCKIILEIYSSLNIIW